MSSASSCSASSGVKSRKGGLSDMAAALSLDEAQTAAGAESHAHADAMQKSVKRDGEGTCGNTLCKVKTRKKKRLMLPQMFLHASSLIPDLTDFPWQLRGNNLTSAHKCQRFSCVTQLRA